MPTKRQVHHLTRALAVHGAGRKPLTAHDPTLTQALERLVDPVTRGDPMGPLLWTCSSAARLATELAAAGHPVSERTVNRLLHELGYSLKANRKTLEGAQHADRDAQFKRINHRVRAFQRVRQPVVSVDTKKELVGAYRNAGREWRPTDSRSRSRCTISWIRRSARRSRMGSTT